ncbi:MAG: phosphate ABC transporter substrate-binding protein [Deltaproteobacteria bacterium]|nr:phosphate ABC transporter substrate-binding protein [Deltaproteobacteria bacterium]
MKAAAIATTLLAAGLALSACKGSSSRHTLLQNKGSDTLVNVAQAWAETYRTVRPEVAVAVSGGGSGTGIAALINGTVDLANASREITPSEAAEIRKSRGADPVQHVVARDAIVIYVHKSNPVKRVTFAQLACIYGEGGACGTWTSVGVEVPSCPGQEIIRISRQSNSGTHEYFREAVLGQNGDLKLGSRDMQGSKDVVDIVAKTPCAIGYSGLGYLIDQVRTVCVSKSEDAPCVEPSKASAADRNYPLSRALYIYTVGEPKAEVAAYLGWIKSEAGQRIVEQSGFVAVR